MDPVTDDYSTIHADEAMQASGLIRAYIMGAVYENWFIRILPQIQLPITRIL